MWSSRLFAIVIVGGVVLSVSGMPKLGQLEEEYEERDLWPLAMVPYKLSLGFSAGEVSKVYGAMGLIENNTCVRFERIEFDPFVKKHRSYLNIVTGSHCESGFGYTGAKQVVRLNPEECMGSKYSLLEYILKPLGINYDNLLNSLNSDIYEEIRFKYCNKKLGVYFQYLQMLNHLKTKGQVLKYALGFSRHNFKPI